MKKALLLTFMVCYGSFAQESFIVKNDGSKIEFKKNSISIDVTKRSLFYKTLDKDTEKSITYKDLDLVEFGSFKFKAFKLNGDKKAEGYFVISETKDKTLISVGIPEEEATQDNPNPVVKYVLYILDNNNNVLDSHSFTSKNDQKNGFLRCQIGYKIKQHFSLCEELLMRLSDYDKPVDGINLSILDFFKKPVYFNCSY